MVNLKKEYNEFGPWLAQILDEEDITHQFIHLKKDILAADIAVKIPVDREWREVKEGELLYDAVVAIDEVGFAYHRIIEGVAYTCKVAFADVDFIHLDSELLSYQLEIGTPLERIHLSYMPMPSELVDRVIQMLTAGFIRYNDNENISNHLLRNGFIYYKEGVKISEDILKECLRISI